MTEQQQQAATSFPLQTEQYVCPNESCESTIPNQYVFRNLDRPGHTSVSLTRTVKAWCSRCQSGWKCRQELRGGVWQTVGAVERITDERGLRGLRARVDVLDGTVQREALSA